MLHIARFVIFSKNRMILISIPLGQIWMNYKYLPVCIPARIVIVLGAISGLTTLPQAALRSNAILQISAACLLIGIKNISNLFAK